MNRRFPLLLLLTFFYVGCNNQNTTTDAAFINTLSKAITIVEEKNAEHFKKLELKYQSDTTDVELKKLYQQFSRIQQAKTEFKNKLSQGQNPDEISTVFVEETFSQLTKTEQQKIQKTFDSSLLMNIPLMKESEWTEVTRYELILEAEELVREMQLLLLKDLNARQPSFQWEYYWEK